jgi:hypothetical protein
MVAGVKIVPVTFNKRVVAGVTYNVYPVAVATRVPVDSSETVDLRAYLPTEDHVLATLAVKSSRPVEVTVSGVYQNIPRVYNLPASTYNQFVFDSSEFGNSFEVHTVILSNPAAAVTQPSPLPAGYPAANVELFAAVYDPS